MTETIFKNFKDILIQFTLSKSVFRVFGEYLKCFKCFKNKMVQGNKTNIMFESINILYVYFLHPTILSDLIGDIDLEVDHFKYLGRVLRDH